ncbi:carboxypeptidase regulatory-like domain-containing protein, partial [Roseiflexus sp.]|uniref:carboxypeptidase regulatory-like domain-containing protein n=1 Tax=Roseiflexus sp. TaxID=2562120 RepID=UPI00398B0D84
AAPGNLVLTGVTKNSVSVTWQDNSNNEDGFKLYRWDGSAWVVHGTVGANVTSYTYGSLACNTQYYLNVNAYNAYGETPAPSSGWLIVTTSACDPPPPVYYTVSGQIRDDSGAPLPGVTVSDGTRSATTDSNGNYTLSNVPAGNYTLTPAKSGYRFLPVTRSISVNANVIGQDFTAASTETAKPIDLTISLYRNPTTNQRAVYEAIIGYFADAVFEQSNGAHKLRSVRIYPDPNGNIDADIRWVRNCWPSAVPSGYGVSGSWINMCDLFTDEKFNIVSNFLQDTEAGGYTLAHEFGHYYYSLYDEYWSEEACDLVYYIYMPCNEDKPVENSIMNLQWKARGGRYAWLNFSTPLNNTRKTAQHRVYLASGWETLVRPLSDDPRPGILRNMWKRLYHPELIAVAPTSGQAPRIDLVNGHQARSMLRVIWEQPLASIAADQSIAAYLNILDGTAVTYPDPIRILAVLRRNLPIAGAVATGEVIMPSGSKQPITLRDDGVAPDDRADDGLYAALIVPTENGDHRIQVVFSNPNATAMEVYDSVSLTPPPPDYTSTLTLPAPQPVTDPFVVNAQIIVSVSGVQNDDHGDNTSNASILTANNQSQWGRIERPGDRDLFQITAPNDMLLVVRVTNLAMGMEPKLRLLAADGQTELASVTGNTVTRQYPFITYRLTSGSTLYAEVSHQNPSASQAVYQISAGAPVISDQWQLYLPLVIQ